MHTHNLHACVHTCTHITSLGPRPFHPILKWKTEVSSLHIRSGWEGLWLRLITYQYTHTHTHTHTHTCTHMHIHTHSHHTHTHLHPLKQYKTANTILVPKQSQSQMEMDCHMQLHIKQRISKYQTMDWSWSIEPRCMLWTHTSEQPVWETKTETLEPARISHSRTVKYSSRS